MFRTSLGSSVRLDMVVALTTGLVGRYGLWLARPHGSGHSKTLGGASDVPLPIDRHLSRELALSRDKISDPSRLKSSTS